MAHMTLDLHSIYNKGREIEVALESLLENALSKKLEFVEVITGKGSGALKKTVLRFFNRKDIRAKYWRLDIDNKNFGRLFVHFKHNKSKGKA
ncbi:MAG: Smr/MutS family protein [Elusimicrobia bacterium]|nr:Smr/MutS family protein [Elusimicrobiota bacterium]